MTGTPKKVNLKKLALLKPTVRQESTQSVIRDTEVEEMDTSGETETEKTERTAIYRMLINKRIQIALKMDCMPYMVASNEALMKMAKNKPVTMSELKQCNCK